MGNAVFHQLYYHIVWTTKQREPLIGQELIVWFMEQIVEDAQKRGARVIACGVMPDHVHLLVSLPPTVAAATLIGPVKGATAHAYNLNTEGIKLRWQEGYGVITLREADLEKVARYVNNQPAIHTSRQRRNILELADNPADDA